MIQPRRAVFCFAEDLPMPGGLDQRQCGSQVSGGVGHPVIAQPRAQLPLGVVNTTARLPKTAEDLSGQRCDAGQGLGLRHIERLRGRPTVAVVMSGGPAHHNAGPPKP